MLENVTAAKHQRLLFLLGKGLKAVKSENQEQAGDQSYDIFSNDFVSFSDPSDQPPNQITKTVRMAKESRPTAQTFTPNGKYLILGMQDGFIEVWSPKTKSLALDILYQNDDIFMRNEQEVTCLCPNRDSHYLASADVGKKVKVWRIEKGSIVKTFENTHSGSINAMIFTPQEDQLATRLR